MRNRTPRLLGCLSAILLLGSVQSALAEETEKDEVSAKKKVEKKKSETSEEQAESRESFEASEKVPVGMLVDFPVDI